MKNISKKIILIVFCLFEFITHPLSIVHNFRIAEVTKQPIPEHNKPDSHIQMNLLFNEYYKRYNDTRIDYFGYFGSIIKNIGEFTYFRADMAFASINETKNYIPSYSSIQTDDILFTLGRDFILNDRSKIVLSGLLGIPTHPIYALDPASFGNGQISSGLQVDGAIKLDARKNLIWGTRYFYFIPGLINNCEQTYTFTLGHSVDALIALKSEWKRHSVQMGYLSRWTFRGYLSPDDRNISQDLNYHRNYFYLIFKYTFKTKRVHHALLLDTTFGYDSLSQKYKGLPASCLKDLSRYQHIFVNWFTWSLYF